MRSALRRLRRDNRGATAIEYGLIAALVVVGAFAGIVNFANGTIRIWNNVSVTVNNN